MHHFFPRSKLRTNSKTDNFYLLMANSCVLCSGTVKHFSYILHRDLIQHLNITALMLTFILWDIEAWEKSFKQLFWKLSCSTRCSFEVLTFLEMILQIFRSQEDLFELHQNLISSSSRSESTRPFIGLFLIYYSEQLRIIVVILGVFESKSTVENLQFTCFNILND